MGASMLRSQNRRKCQAASSDRDQDPPLDERAIKLMKHNVNCRPDDRDMVLSAQLFCYAWILLIKLISVLFCSHRPAPPPLPHPPTPCRPPRLASVSCPSIIMQITPRSLLDLDSPLQSARNTFFPTAQYPEVSKEKLHIHKQLWYTALWHQLFPTTRHLHPRSRNLNDSNQSGNNVMLNGYLRSVLWKK